MQCKVIIIIKATNKLCQRGAILFLMIMSIIIAMIITKIIMKVVRNSLQQHNTIPKVSSIVAITLTSRVVTIC